MIPAVMIEGEPNATLKRCFDCYYCQAAVSWWCTNKEANKYSGTSIPGYRLCKFWKPCLTLKGITWFQRHFCSYIKIKQSSDKELAEMIDEVAKEEIDTSGVRYLPTGFVGFNKP